MSAHAKLSASAAHRWLSCPGSVRLSELFGDTGSTIYAEEGTLAHAAAEAMICGKKPKKKAITDFYKSHPELDGSADEMLKVLEPYVGYVKEEYEEQKRIDPATSLMTEQRVDMRRWVPGGFGTSDVIIIREGRLHIIDLKYGKGVPVLAEDNPQLKLYALGALDLLDMAYEVKEVYTTIYQPRLDSVSTVMMMAEDLYQWADEVVKPGAELALTEDAPQEAGDWCIFCPARRRCKARADLYMELEDYKAQRTLQPEQIGEVLERVEGLVKWAEDLKEGALQGMLEGEDIPGWKVVEGRSIRKYSADEAEIVKKAEEAGYASATLYERKLLSISAMEKLMGKKTFAEVLGGCVEKPQGKPTLAPESDKRPAIANVSAADDFADEN